MPAPGPSGATTVTVTLPALIDELKNHVSADKAPELDRLVAQARDNPKEQAAVKRRMGELATRQQLTAAVNALIERSATAPVPAPALSSGADSSSPSASGSEAGGSGSLPAELLPLIDSLDKEDFRASLIHCFHCRTPSCPVPGCVPLTAKLERLHAHVSSCTAAQAQGCALCRMWAYLKDYRDAVDHNSAAGASQQANTQAPGLCQALYVEPLLKSSQLLPRWKDGRVEWKRRKLDGGAEESVDPDLAAAWDMPAAARVGGAQDESGIPPLAELGAMGSLSALEQQLADAHEGRLGAGLPLGDSASFRMSGLPLASSLSSNFNLESVLKATSMTDLGLNFRRSASQLRDKNDELNDILSEFDSR
ncbi:hypothetical protein EMIHUDRAFT_454354 [Emiliania huxleyi CCMP1516]|uniref:TAZ-type domain-containing protein n=2 Tax=Emiliania huxleyi TaxID=2903 RepID=A0A0D3KW24_EMIH1|nr:hypothetical protein EMIHUDRAFT_458151 [Emiliania huxleyi CCMP1516]XP_005792388.1 hypothetical protein EMIHUDRAFT_454354 [Emiliania huxleyi CCMP1516]EOD22490.1 hypothetical protein EMIHUDRAFT_458151 [Emiliania huxleyi CCMP1516]EOD39959.1 hypothetical protein EMIHUDRAFT_454354 [Emiliania huxleyi CCMP1516]|eukprot:XP_005774919.1 hypothetical protein EMIHUDRAFT_458151 [Emiliania huxleyi CCMP1516]